MPDTRLVQCELSCGPAVTCGWIPARVARRGIRMLLPDLGRGWWTVTAVYGTLSAEAVQEQGRAYKDFQGSTRGGGIDQQREEMM